jgi:hypothetical protein
LIGEARDGVETIDDVRATIGDVANIVKTLIEAKASR